MWTLKLSHLSEDDMEISCEVCISDHAEACNGAEQFKYLFDECYEKLTAMKEKKIAAKP